MNELIFNIFASIPVILIILSPFLLVGYLIYEFKYIIKRRKSIKEIMALLDEIIVKIYKSENKQVTPEEADKNIQKIMKGWTNEK